MPVKKEVFILEHVPNEKAGTLVDFLKNEKIPFREIPLYKKNFAFPDLSRARALVVMGGPMNVYEEGRYPFLGKENQFIQKAVTKGVPYLGICLGAQLLAKALGARVYKAEIPEVGWSWVWLAREAKKENIFKGLEVKKLRLLQWHEDTYDLPQGATRLAASLLVPNQAYVCGNRFYGFQFHIEINRPMLEDWFRNHPEKNKILRKYDLYKTELRRIADIIYANFFKLP